MVGFVSVVGGNGSVSGPSVSSRGRSSCSVGSVTQYRVRSGRVRVYSESNDEISEVERKPEPYPGYYKDLEKSGAADIAAAASPTKKERKVGGKKSLYRPDGRAYAPWMIGTLIEEPGEFAPVASKTDAKGKLAVDPQQQELAGVGLKSKMLGDELELSWSTGSEENIAGFSLQRRRGKDSVWEQLDDYKTSKDLKSKGVKGGDYSYLIPKPEPGTWIYRVSDVSENGAVNDLSQTLVEIESEEDQKKQKLALAVFVILAVIFAAIGFLSDPQSGYGN
uniref:Uncharacterized protein n=1 Tax=Timspurckia oligopyrenoides TaxID=708627 RepID=A0A7S1EU49_9RHOD|mmetsp:Transcript_7427/g.13412  ORF Transcript_7427/g.13412 Transcript_7427/m.13412 type:complete len:278 (+) Transcript_7427:34-867(+)